MTILTTDVTTAVATVYTSTGNTAVTYLNLCNYSVANVTANIYVVPNSGTPGSLNQAVQNLQINVGDSYQLYSGSEKLLLSNGDSVQVNASSNTSVTAIASYTSI